MEKNKHHRKESEERGEKKQGLQRMDHDRHRPGDKTSRCCALDEEGEEM